MRNGKVKHKSEPKINWKCDWITERKSIEKNIEKNGKTWCDFVQWNWECEKK